MHLLAQAIDDMRRSFRPEGLIPQTALAAGDIFFELLQFFFQALAFGGDIDFLLVDQVDVEACRVPRSGQLRQGRFHERNRFHIRLPVVLNCAPILLDQFSNLGLVRVQLDRRFHPGLDFQLGAQVAHADDQVLQHGHVGLGFQVDLLRVRLREAGERDRFQRRLAIVDRMPDFFRDEWHHGMEQAQRSFK